MKLIKRKIIDLTFSKIPSFVLVVSVAIGLFLVVGLSIFLIWKINNTYNFIENSEKNGGF